MLKVSGSWTPPKGLRPPQALLHLLHFYISPPLSTFSVGIAWKYILAITCFWYFSLFTLWNHLLPASKFLSRSHFCVTTPQGVSISLSLYIYIYVYMYIYFFFFFSRSSLYLSVTLFLSLSLSLSHFDIFSFSVLSISLEKNIYIIYISLSLCLSISIFFTSLSLSYMAIYRRPPPLWTTFWPFFWPISELRFEPCLGFRI